MDILFPVFLLFAHTVFVAFRLGYLRYTAVVRKEVDPEFFVAYQGEEPANLRIASRHLINLLETPMLFYVGCLVAFVTNQTGMLPVALAWSYVVLRLLHSYIHLGPNVVIWRFRIFGVSLIVLVAMWLVLFIGLITR